MESESKNVVREFHDEPTCFTPHTTHPHASGVTGGLHIPIILATAGMKHGHTHAEFTTGLTSTCHAHIRTYILMSTISILDTYISANAHIYDDDEARLQRGLSTAARRRHENTCYNLRLSPRA